MSEPVLKVVGLCLEVPPKSSNSTRRALLEDVSLEIAEGEVLGLVGKSGAGKSTLLRTLARLTEATRGYVELQGVHWDRIDVLEYRRRVSLITQVPVVFPGTIHKNFELVTYLRRGRTSLSFSKLLEKVGLENSFLARDAHTLSGGERQRLALARALLARPQVLLMDEPASAIDALGAEILISKVKSICETEGVSALLTSHIPEHLRFANRIIRMEEGRVLKDG